jgi:hypothetical protein
MKLQRTTLVLLVTAFLLGGVVYLSEISGRQNQEATKTTKQPIFAFKEDDIQSVTIDLGKEVLDFERISGQLTHWQMKQPKDAPASDAAVAFLLDLLAEGKSDHSFLIQANQLKEFGLDKPMATVRVKLKNQQIHRLVLGKPDFNRSFLYAQADPATTQIPQALKVLLVPIDFEYAVNRPMSEWQTQPKPLESPKPSPTPGSSQPSPTPKNPKPSSGSKTPPASPTPVKAKPSPSSGSKTPPASPTPARAKPSPSSGSKTPPASPAPEKAKPSSTPKTPPASPTPEKAKPSSTSTTPQASSTSTKPKPLPTPNSSKPSPTEKK